MDAKVEQTPANPMLSVAKDGTILYSNEVSKPLLLEWEAEIGEKLPSNIEALVQKVISQNYPEKMEVKAGDKVYLVVFSSIPDENRVNISGFDISDQKETEEKLLESEVQCRLIFNNSFDAVLFTSPDGTIYAANSAACQMFGMTDEEIIQADLNGIVDASDPRLKPILEERAKIGRSKGELNLRRKDGTVFPSEVSSVLFKDKNSNVKTAIVVRDITERKKSEEAPQEREKSERVHSDELEAVLDAVPVAVYISRDPQTLEITGNRLSYEWQRIPAGTNFSKSAPKGEGPEIFKLFKNGVELSPEEMPSQMAATGKEINDYEVDIVSVNGEIRHVLGNARPLRDEQGNIRGSISAFIDITERKKAEEALLKSEERYRMLFTNMIDGFGLVEVIYNNEGKPHDYRYLEINPAFESYLGIKRERILGKTMLELFPDVSPIALENYGEVALSGKSIHFEIFSQVANKYLDIYTFSPEKGKLGLVLRDVSQRKKTEINLKETLENLENLVKERTSELEKAYNSLKESEKGLAEAQKMAHIGNWEWNLSTNELYYSDELYRIFGFNPQEFDVSFDEVLTYIHPEDRDYVVDSIMEALRTYPKSPAARKVIHAHAKWSMAR